jgi:hypothetical protein
MKATYDYLGLGYNHTRKADPYLFQQLFTCLNPKNDGIYLDINCGTRNYTYEFHKKAISIQEKSIRS